MNIIDYMQKEFPIDNKWKIGCAPRTKFSNLVLDWFGSDSLENFKNKKVASEFDSWKFTYRYNAQGFRTKYDLEEFHANQTPCHVALGCSFTEGIGLPDTISWPSQLEEKLKFPIINLGVGGSSTDTIARILTNVSSYLNIKNVYILWAFIHRFEEYTEDNIISVYSRDLTPGKVWYADTPNSLQRFYKNYLIVQNLSKIYNFSVSECYIDQVFNELSYNKNILKDYARDGMHAGRIFHEQLANHFYKLSL